MIAPDDRGFTLGDGLFETLLALDGVPVHWDEHITRMMESARALGLPKPDAEAALNLVEASLKRAGLATGRAAVRINWSAGSGGRGLDAADLDRATPDTAAVSALARTAASEAAAAQFASSGRLKTRRLDYLRAPGGNTGRGGR